MKLGYGNYGMRDEDVFEALPRLREMGYEAIELTVSGGWPTTPDRLDQAARRRLAEQCASLGFPSPALLGLPDGDDPRTAFRSACELARDLRFGDGPAVICTMPPGAWSDWDAQKDSMRDRLLDWAEIAEDHDVVIAVEPHVGMALDTPEKSSWLMKSTAHASLKLNFDHSHFHVIGIGLQTATELCMPHAAHIHIKDGHMVDGAVEFLLPGEGDMDLAAYCRAVQKTGTELPITVEVSGMVWNRPDYDPWRAAESCFRALDQARQAA